MIVPQMMILIEMIMMVVVIKVIEMMIKMIMIRIMLIIMIESDVGDDRDRYDVDEDSGDRCCS